MSVRQYSERKSVASITSRTFNGKATNVVYHTIEGGNTRVNSEKMRDFIRTNMSTKCQIIALTSNETDIEDGDNVLTLLYRTEPIKVLEKAPDDIDFDQGSTLTSWEKQRAAEAGRVFGGKEVIAISCTPKNIGNMRC